MIRSRLARNSTLSADISWDEMRAFLAAPNGVLWVDLEMPSDDEFKVLAEVFQFHPLAIEDAHKDIELPKVDIYPGYAYLVVHRIQVDFETCRVSPREMDIFISDHYLVTVHEEVSQSTSEVAARIDHTPALLSAGPDVVMHDIIDRIVDRYMPVLDRWEDEIDALEEGIFIEREGDAVLEKALRLRREVAELRKSLGPQRDILQKLSRRDIPHVSEKTALYFRDVYDHLIRIGHNLETHREHIASLFETYMATASNRMNLIMKRLTSLATLFLPLSFVAGVYGMNFQHIPGLDWRYGFTMICLIMGGMAIAMLWFFRREGWW